jgi:hypothetical protein
MEKNFFFTKDKFSMLISLIAVILSLLSFYISNIRVKNNLQARIVNTDIIKDTHLKNDSIYRDTAVIQVAFMNAGNRQAIVLKPYYYLTGENNEQSFTAGGEFTNNNEIPFMLQPHEMKLINLKLSLEEINLNPGSIIDSTDKKKTYQSFCKLQFYGLDSKAEIYNIFTTLQVQIITDDNSIKGVLSANNKAYNAYKSTIIIK